MNKFLLSSNAKKDLIKIDKYTQLTWATAQQNDYLKILDSTYKLLAIEAELGINFNCIIKFCSNPPQSGYVTYDRTFLIK
ncbi:type II toxin-antitoxin system RelE/ParE family toxin [Colwellia hornerae]|uniref:Type II toxin-antitoxin system RelE/ParE family toxin n=1 Tax=Colwellia hornerae TaxID=89402 RepID=A0A5C6QLG7_9GAMM|nr:type II toxin-antitoxin system RelE/ParE family toxin [Colwellia hornerae]TWX53650.1 type II toxin-antitoxin system RelE/ParE family toxin [Colwellia hornerae]TWX60301.1 type II toxin-antitoxin system RelE/ParE family toxin [Colwellia hornerae]TWX70056.1 type II toxin-antitoxin system RelE/ParE family toxin [Colwellia hornerae]